MFDDLDKDRLHDVIEGKYTTRGAGKTTAMIAHLVSIAQLNAPYANIIVVAHTEAWARQLLRMLDSALSSEKIRHIVMSPFDIHITNSGQIFSMKTIENIKMGDHEQFLRLYNYFLDMPEEKEYQCSEFVCAELDKRLIGE